MGVLGGWCSCRRDGVPRLCLSLGTILKALAPHGKLMGVGGHKERQGPFLQQRRSRQLETYPGWPRIPGKARECPRQSVLVTRGQSQVGHTRVCTYACARACRHTGMTYTPEVCTHVCEHTLVRDTCVHKHTCVHGHVSAHARTHTRVGTYAGTHSDTYARARTHTHTQTLTYPEHTLLPVTEARAPRSHQPREPAVQGFHHFTAAALRFC